MAKKDDSKKTKKTKPETTPKSISVGGNITGEVVVIGDNNVVKYYSVVEKNIKENDPDYWNLKHPYPMPPNFTGRLAERAMLTQWLNDDSENRLFILRALGGFGKSALTWHWLTHDVDPIVWKKVIFWSFYEGDSSFESFVKETLEYLKIEVPQGGRTQVDELLKALQKEKVLLIMDGFERVLRAYSSMSAAYQGDEEPKLEDNQFDCVNLNAEIFLKSICSLPNIKSKILMTTRLTPRTVKPRGEFMLGCKEVELTAMQKEDAVEFFKKQGIIGNHNEIESACAPYGYHPLSLRILAGYILKDFENPADIAVAQRLRIDGDIIQQKNHVMKVAYDTLTPNRQKLIGTIACFRSPVELKALESIAEDKNSLNDDLHDLIERGLLHFDDKNKKFDLHPIVRRYVYERLTALDRSAIHTLIIGYLEFLPKPNKVENLADLSNMLELYYHLTRVDKFKDAGILYTQYLLPLYYHFGEYQLMIDLLVLLFPDGENNLPYLKDTHAQPWFLNELANAYSLSGQPNRAVPLFELHNLLRHKEENEESIAVGLVNLAGQQLNLGKLKDADINLRRQLKLCQRISFEFNINKGIGIQELGHLLIYCGKHQDAKQELDLAFALFENEKLKQSQGIIWFYRALRFFMMSRNMFLSKDKKKNLKSRLENLISSSARDAKRALKLADVVRNSEHTYPPDYIHAYWLIGASYRVKGDFYQAEDNLFKAISICRETNLVESEADILLEIAKLRYSQEDYEEAKSLVDEALTITERCGYVLQGADVNLFLSQYALEQEKDKVKAKEYAETALKLAYCDGPPYYYKVAYHEAEAMLEKINKLK